jgi:hypothetical protein
LLLVQRLERRTCSPIGPFSVHRIDNVMQIEKWRGKAREALSKLPDPLETPERVPRQTLGRSRRKSASDGPFCDPAGPHASRRCAEPPVRPRDAANRRLRPQ